MTASIRPVHLGWVVAGIVAMAMAPVHAQFAGSGSEAEDTNRLVAFLDGSTADEAPGFAAFSVEGLPEGYGSAELAPAAQPQGFGASQYGAGGFRLLSIGLRSGWRTTNDGDARSVFGFMFQQGLDIRYHVSGMFPEVPVSVQLTLDTAYTNDGDVTEIDEFDFPGWKDEGSSATLNAYRILVLYEPLPGMLGDDPDNMYISPYGGLGIGLYQANVTFRWSMPFGEASWSESATTLGVEFVGGGELVFQKRFAVGMQMSWSLAQVYMFESVTNIGGFGFMFMGRLLF